jgi:hypothetical protein
MTHSPALLRFALLAAGLVGLAARLPAQDRPRPVVSTRADEPAKGPLKGQTTNLVLRPNADAPFSVYVENPDANQTFANLTVRVTADPDGGLLLAEGTVGSVGPRQFARVALHPAAPPGGPAAAPPVEPAPPPAAEKGQAPPAAPKPPAGAPLLTTTLYVQVFRDGKTPLSDKPAEFTVRVDTPKNYLEAVPQVTRTGTGYQLTVTLNSLAGEAGVFRGKPAVARLDLRPDLMPGLDPASLKDGTFQTAVAPGAKGVALVAKNLQFAGRPVPSFFAVSVDGYDRAFVFATDFTGTTPAVTPASGRSVRIDAPRFGVPGRPLPVRLEVFNDDWADRPRLEFQRAEQGAPEVVTTPEQATPRYRDVRLRVGPAGELLFHAEVKDWVLPLDTAGVYGKRTLRLALTDADGKVLTQTQADGLNKPEADIILDDTPPDNVQLLALPPKPPPKKPRKLPPPEAAAAKSTIPPGGIVLPPWACGCVLPWPVPMPPPPEKPAPPPAPGVIARTLVRGTTVELVARAEDLESGVTRVLFFVGPPPGPDGKPPPGGKVLESRLRPPPEKLVGPPPTWVEFGATLDLPDVKGPVTVGVRFTNGAGLVSPDVTREIWLVDPVVPTTGTIEGKVIQGSSPERPQPGLDVLLLDAGGKVVKATKTTDTGEFRFEELPPGPYTVYTVKPADLGARSLQPATVEAGEVTAVTLELRR